MTATFTLDNLRTSVKRKFEPVTISLDEDTTISLPSVLRLGKKDREAVSEILDDLKNFDDGEDDDEDLSDAETELVIDTISSLFKRISPKSKKLVAAIEDEEPLVQLSILTEILNAWFERTQPGEASDSPV